MFPKDPHAPKSGTLHTPVGDRRVHDRPDAPIPSADVEPVGGRENWAGESTALLPLTAAGATLEEASARLDTAVTAITDAIRQIPGIRIMHGPNDIPALLEVHECYIAVLRAQVQAQARKN
jgi:hypothetical protein